MSRQMLLGILLCVIIVFGCNREPRGEGQKHLDLKTNNTATVNESAKEVKLTIDTGDPKAITVKVPYAGEKMTVRDTLKGAESQGISAVFEGEGEGAMLQSLQGIGNEGGGKEAKNWIFYVNGKQATVSSAVYSLQPGDVIIWRFEKYE